MFESISEQRDVIRGDQHNLSLEQSLNEYIVFPATVLTLYSLSTALWLKSTAVQY